MSAVVASAMMSAAPAREPSAIHACTAMTAARHMTTKHMSTVNVTSDESTNAQ